MTDSFLGVDVGGTFIKIGVVSPAGELSHTRQVSTPKDPTELVELVVAQYRATPTAALGLVTPGIVDEPAGIVRFSANLGWRELPMQRMLADQLECPVAFGHDVRAGALAESRWGHGGADMLFLPLGTGIAAALILGGRIVGSGWSGEIGQVLVDNPDGAGRLEFEKIASAAAIARRYQALTGVECNGSKAVFELALQSDKTAVAVIDSAIETLGDMLANLAAMLGPIPIVIGGGLAEAGDRLFEPLRSELARRLAPQAMPILKRAELGQWAGCLGAAALGMNAGG